MHIECQLKCQRWKPEENPWKFRENSDILRRRDLLTFCLTAERHLAALSNPNKYRPDSGRKCFKQWNKWSEVAGSRKPDENRLISRWKKWKQFRFKPRGFSQVTAVSIRSSGVGLYPLVQTGLSGTETTCFRKVLKTIRNRAKCVVYDAPGHKKRWSVENRMKIGEVFAK